MRIYGPRYESALAFACSQHHGQVRKGSGAPYISHPLAVSSLVADYGGDEDQAIAALLHDVLEDCGVTREELEARYGARVASIVVAATDTTDDPKPPWRPRKEAHIAKVKEQPPEVKLVLSADKLHNAQSIVRDLGRRSVGADVFNRFTADKPDVQWYYRAMWSALAHGFDHEIIDELDRIVTVIEAA